MAIKPLRLRTPLRPRRGKACGASFIPGGFDCTKATRARSNNSTNRLRLAGSNRTPAFMSPIIRRKGGSMSDWRKSVNNPRNRPKISPDLAERIANEAEAGGQKWEVQEAINKRRADEIAAECRLGKPQGAAKLDSFRLKPRCYLGEGSFGQYFVHPSKKYGIKVMNYDSLDPDIEYDLLGKAHYAGANVPEPLSMNSTNKDKFVMVMRHMDGYERISKLDPISSDLFRVQTIYRLKVARQFRILHAEGIAHGDIHGGNILHHPRTKKVAIIDFGYATDIDSPSHPNHNRDGIENLDRDLIRLPEFLGLPLSFNNTYVDMRNHILDLGINYNRKWEQFEVAVNRYHDAIEAAILKDSPGIRTRSRVVAEVAQPKIPGLFTDIVQKQLNNPGDMRMILWMAQTYGINDTRIQNAAQAAGMRPAAYIAKLRALYGSSPL